MNLEMLDKCCADGTILFYCDWGRNGKYKVREIILQWRTRAKNGDRIYDAFDIKDRSACVVGPNTCVSLTSTGAKLAYAQKMRDKAYAVMNKYHAIVEKHNQEIWVLNNRLLYEKGARQNG